MGQELFLGDLEAVVFQCVPSGPQDPQMLPDFFPRIRGLWQFCDLRGHPWTTTQPWIFTGHPDSDGALPPKQLGAFLVQLIRLTQEKCTFNLSGHLCLHVSSLTRHNQQVDVSIPHCLTNLFQGLFHGAVRNTGES